MKIMLTWVGRKQRTSASGKPYTSLSLKSQEHGDKYLSGFGNKDNADWKAGDSVDVEVKEVVKDGNTYLNFDTPKAAPAHNPGFAEIKNLIELRIDKKLDAIWGRLGLILEKLNTDVEDGLDPDAIDKAFSNAIDKD